LEKARAAGEKRRCDATARGIPIAIKDVIKRARRAMHLAPQKSAANYIAPTIDVIAKL